MININGIDIRDNFDVVLHTTGVPDEEAEVIKRLLERSGLTVNHVKTEAW